MYEFLAAFHDTKLIKFDSHISDIPYRYISFIRWLHGVIAITQISHVIDIHGYTSGLLPWLSVGLGLHVGFGYTMKQKKYKVCKLVCCPVYPFMIITKNM